MTGDDHHSLGSVEARAYIRGMNGKHFLVRRDRLREHRVTVTPRRALAPGEVELEVDRFGLTSNNVTYGVLGESFSYWQFFPTDEPGWGTLPVWGFGSVTRSNTDGVAVGERFYGYFPMSSHLVVAPRRVGESGFLDGALHRRGLHGVYNQYLRTTHDPSYDADTESHQVVLRPLFATAFFLADFLQDSGFFGAESVLISSASSKLGWATAFMLRQGRAHARQRLVALTSPGHVDFVNHLALYDRVLTYEDVSSLRSDEGAVLVDLAGHPRVREAVHRHFGEALRYSSAVGATHWETLGRSEDLPGPVPVTFFAPAWIKQRSELWGPAEVQRRLGAAWRTLVERATSCVRIVDGAGESAVARIYDDLVSGRARPDEGYVLSLVERGVGMRIDGASEAS
jgi:hypothetical protein